MPLRKGLVQCSLRSKMVDATILWHLAAEPQHHVSRTTIAPSLSSWHWSGASLNTPKNIWLMPHLQCVLTTIPTYVLTTPNLDMTGHCWVGAFASYEFTLEYQKGSDNAADALSRVPVNHDKDTVWSLLEGAVTGATERGEALRVEHDCLSEESQAHTLRLALMHVTNWAEAHGEDEL